MHLLNTREKRLETFMGEIPPYAILSHTWEQDEITFDDILASTRADQKAGWLKVDHACRQAAKDGYNYIWIDTCCIDKASSAELSEAINSMFKWYQNAEVCYAFLKDVSAIQNVEVNLKEFKSSRWFTRGWTLQELIAPKRVEFFDVNWGNFANKQRMASSIRNITGIPVEVLSDTENLWSTSIACRMSWASRRQTTRIEDMAYSLLGIFGVNMPLLYGEGSKAFLRLQEEIIKISDDQSIFVWTTKERWSAALAQSPSYFDSGWKVATPPRDTSQGPYSMTHMGLSIKLPMMTTGAFFGKQKMHAGLLQCHHEDDFTNQIAMFLCETETEGVFARCQYRGLYCGIMNAARGMTKATLRQIYIESPSQNMYSRPVEVLCLLSGPADLYKISMAKAKGVDAVWNSQKLVLRLRRSPSSFNHDIAAGFVFSKLSDTAFPDAFLVVLYFPHQSSNITEISGIKLYHKEQNWDIKEWESKATTDLSLVHIQESIATQETLSTITCTKTGGDVTSPIIGPRYVSVSASLSNRAFLNQKVYIVDIGVAAEERKSI